MKYNITFGDTVCIHTYYGVILREEFTISQLTKNLNLWAMGLLTFI